MSTMSIGEVARRARLRASAIRYYEDAGLLPAPRRVSGRRRYDPSVLDRLAIIRLAQGSGFSVSELRTLMRDGEAAGGIAQTRHMVQTKLVEIEARIRDGEEMRALLQRWLACNCSDVTGCDLVAEQAQAPRVTEARPRRQLAIVR